MIPILRLNVDDNPRIIVKQEQSHIIYTGYTSYNLIGSGGTSVNSVISDSHIDFTIFSEPPTGVSVNIFSNYTGATYNILTGHTSDIQYLSGQTLANYQCCTGVTSSLTSHSENTLIHTPYSAITQLITESTSGLTSSWSGLTGAPTDNIDLMTLFDGKSNTGHTHNQYITGITSSDVTGITNSLYVHNDIFNNYTGQTYNDLTGITSSISSHINDLDIHYQMSGISINQDQVINLVSDLAGKSSTGHTHSQYITGITSSDVTGITNSLYASIIHLHPQYLTGYTLQCSDVTGCTSGLYANINHSHAYSAITDTPDLDVYALESNLTGHTGDLTIHYPMSGISINQSQVVNLINDLAGKSSTGHTHPQYLTGVTSSNITGITDSLYAPIVHTHAYSAITNTPNLSIYQPISGMTIYSQTGHTHPQYLTGYTLQCSDVTGCTDGLYSLINHTHSQYITGITSSDVTGITNGLYANINHSHSYSAITNTPDLSVYALESNLTGHTGDLSIHYPMSGISINQSQVVNLVSDLAGKSSTGHTHPQYLTGFTVTCDMITGCTSGLYANINHSHAYSAITDTPDLGIYLTGATGSGATEVSIVNGNLTIYSPTPTGGTEATLIGSGATEVVQSGDTWIVYSPTGGTGSVEWGDITGTLSGQTDLQEALDNKADKLATIKEITATTYTLLEEDNSKILEFTNTGAVTITIPSGSTFTEGFQVTLVSYGNGTTSGIKTIAAQAGATVKSKNAALKLATIFGAATVYKTPTAATWVAFGDLTD